MVNVVGTFASKSQRDAVEIDDSAVEVLRNGSNESRVAYDVDGLRLEFDEQSVALDIPSAFSGVGEDARLDGVLQDSSVVAQFEDGLFDRHLVDVVVAYHLFRFVG